MTAGEYPMSPARRPQERAQTERFDSLYVMSQSPVMLAVERDVCGCKYGGNSWTTRSEAQKMVTLMDGRGYVDSEGRMVFSYAHPIFWAPFMLVSGGGTSSPAA
jgi:hypothetical protein